MKLDGSPTENGSHFNVSTPIGIQANGETKSPISVPSPNLSSVDSNNASLSPTQPVGNSAKQKTDGLLVIGGL